MERDQRGGRMSSGASVFFTLAFQDGNDKDN